MKNHRNYTRYIREMNMKKKYKMTEEIIVRDGHILHRIEALVDFGDVKKGDKGGWIEKEDNLSGNAWVYEDAKVYGNATVSQNAKIYGEAEIYENSKVFGEAKVYGIAEVYGNCEVHGKSEVYGNADIYGSAEVFENAKIFDRACVKGNAYIYGHSSIHGISCVHGEAEICGNASVESDKDYIVFKNFWSSGRYFTYTRSNKMWSVGCFYGTGDQLIKKAYRDSEISGRNYERIVRYVEEVEEKEF